MMIRLLFAGLLLVASTIGAGAWLIQKPAGGGGGSSCTANITGSGTAEAILTGSATALSNLTCQ